MLRRVPAILVAVAALALTAAPAALATTQTAHAGNVVATFTFQGRVPSFHGLHLTISRGGAMLYDEPVVSKFCGKLCWPGPASQPALLGAGRRPRGQRRPGRRARPVQRRRSLLHGGSDLLVRSGHHYLRQDRAGVRRPRREGRRSRAQRPLRVPHRRRLVRLPVHRLRGVGAADRDPDLRQSALHRRDAQLPEAHRQGRRSCG